ncbi:MAG: response regulator transcription factor [Hyphomicrobium sp.]|nr:response regulator transcription factor [Hyphomicrobium sp.]
MKILIVDDHGVVREGLSRLLSAHFDVELSEAPSVDSALETYKRERPNVVILDLNLEGPGGLEMLRRLHISDNQAKVIIFSMHHEPVYAVRALRAGARGYVSKSAPVEELLMAVRTVASGGQYVDRDLASRIATSHASNEDPLQVLSLREVEILRLLGQGKSMTAISEGLGIAYKTVANICTQMKVKLGVDRTADLIRLAVETLKP